jgi:hypothetical protein
MKVLNFVDLLGSSKIEQMDCGLMDAQIQHVRVWDRGVYDRINESFPNNPHRYTFDIKVHMLMPGQYPCIPNWHFDMVPRDGQNKVQLDKRKDTPMYLWLSNGPYTEFKADVGVIQVPSKTWVEFTQFDEHRGVASTGHQWRMFVRAVPKEFRAPKHLTESASRRHAQVYLDASNFKW